VCFAVQSVTFFPSLVKLKLWKQARFSGTFERSWMDFILSYRFHILVTVSTCWKTFLKNTRKNRNSRVVCVFAAWSIWQFAWDVLAKKHIACFPTFSEFSIFGHLNAATDAIHLFGPSDDGHFSGSSPVSPQQRISKGSSRREWEGCRTTVASRKSSFADR
jgi:hypothetical protein